ncbi:CrcB-like protein-domain-containing protein [Gaertneriomyces semiglobifer]|nr:CrcB-like protein-domain-containing protein [Gaertneriomyces semiglobifer]
MLDVGDSNDRDESEVRSSHAHAAVTSGSNSIREVESVARLNIEDEHHIEEESIQVPYRFLSIFLWLILCSVAGVLIRIGLLKLHTYRDAPIVPVIYPQIVGCVLIGWLNANKHAIAKCYYPLFIGLATGLCGSITTFSGWSLSTFTAFANLETQASGHSVLAGIAVIIVVLGMSIMAVMFGEQVAGVISLEKASGNSSQPKLNFVEQTQGRTAECYLTLVLTTAVVIAAVLLSVFVVAHRGIWFATLFGPPGTILRFQLSKLNVRSMRFAYGTFIANILGTALLAGLFLARYNVPLHSTSCHIIIGFSDGFCGCLTTVSTFIIELRSMPTRYAYIYGLTSILFGQIVMVAIAGAYVWSQGVRDLTCTG